jgi:hypothetical protein
LRQVYDYAAAKMVAAVMVAAAKMVDAVDSDQVDAAGEVDSDRHDSYGDDKMATVCSGDGVAAVLVCSSNNIESNCMDNKPHHDLVLYLKARCMNSMSSTPIKQSKSFSYLLLFYYLLREVKIQPAELKIQSCCPIQDPSTRMPQPSDANLPDIKCPNVICHNLSTIKITKLAAISKK